MACPLLPPFLVTLPGVKPWDSVNSPSALPSMWNSCQLISPLLFFANLTFLLMPSPYFFKPSSISFHSLYLQPFKFSFQMPSHPSLQSEIQSEKPGIHSSLQHDPLFCFCFINEQGFFSPQGGRNSEPDQLAIPVCTEDCAGLSVLCVQPSKPSSHVVTILNT